MLQYSRILRLKAEGLSLRSIASSTGNSRQKITEVIERAKKRGLVPPLDDEMNDKWLEEFLFPEKSLRIQEGSQLISITSMRSWQNLMSPYLYCIMNMSQTVESITRFLTPIGALYVIIVTMRTSIRRPCVYGANPEK
jgi:hypothetical protein